jgi:hypothetical protein
MYSFIFSIFLSHFTLGPTTPPNGAFKNDNMYFSSYIFFQGVVLNQISGMGLHQDKKIVGTLST